MKTNSAKTRLINNIINISTRYSREDLSKKELSELREIEARSLENQKTIQVIKNINRVY